MIIELNTKLAELPQDLNMNQLVFLSMVLGNNQKYNQDVQKIVSLIEDNEISYLAEQGLITSKKRGDSITYLATEKLLQFVAPAKDYFDLFYDMYPVYVTRPNGTKSYLRANVNKCRKLYNSYVGSSQKMAEHINDCLKFEIDKNFRNGNSNMYMKTMWRWLQDHQWEASEAEMQDTEKESTTIYGTELI